MERASAAWRRRLVHFGRHPLWWARYLASHELRRRDVLFGNNPRFRDWSPMFDVALPELARLTGARPEELRACFEEIRPLHEELLRAVGGLPSAGAMMQAPLLYVLVRTARPEVIVETGVSSGFSARLILEALARNGSGRLWSIGIQKIAVGLRPETAGTNVAERPVGWLVPDSLRGRWNLRIGPSEELLGKVLGEEAMPLGMFVHDSLHLYDAMTAEYRTAWPYLAPGGWLLSHDIHNNRAWADFLAAHSLRDDAELDHDLGAVRVPAASG